MGRKGGTPNGQHPLLSNTGFPIFLKLDNGPHRPIIFNGPGSKFFPVGQRHKLRFWASAPHRHNSYESISMAGWEITGKVNQMITGNLSSRLKRIELVQIKIKQNINLSFRFEGLFCLQHIVIFNYLCV